VGLFVGVDRGVIAFLAAIQPAQRAIIGLAVGVGQARVFVQRLDQLALRLGPQAVALGLLVRRVERVAFAAQRQPQRGNRRGEARLLFQGVLQQRDGPVVLAPRGIEIAQQVIGRVVVGIELVGVVQHFKRGVDVARADLLLGQDQQREHAKRLAGLLLDGLDLVPGVGHHAFQPLREGALHLVEALLALGQPALGLLGELGRGVGLPLDGAAHQYAPGGHRDRDQDRHALQKAQDAVGEVHGVVGPVQDRLGIGEGHLLAGIERHAPLVPPGDEQRQHGQRYRDHDEEKLGMLPEAAPAAG